MYTGNSKLILENMLEESRHGLDPSLDKRRTVGPGSSEVRNNRQNLYQRIMTKRAQAHEVKNHPLVYNDRNNIKMKLTDKNINNYAIGQSNKLRNDARELSSTGGKYDNSLKSSQLSISNPRVINAAVRGNGNLIHSSSK